MPDLRVRELVVVAPLIALLIFLGVYPKPLTDIVNPAVDHTLSVVDKKDPKPTVQVDAVPGGRPARPRRARSRRGGREVSSVASVHSLWTVAAGAPGKIPAPHIEYAQLAPTLIVLGAAVIGVLVEAFVPRRNRYYSQLLLSLVALAAAFAAVIGLAAGGFGSSKAHIAAMGAHRRRRPRAVPAGHDPAGVR